MEDKPRVVVVDDHQSMRDTLEIFFSREGWDVKTFSDGGQAIEFLKGNISEGGECVELVITDLVMEGVDGIEVLKKARQIDSTCQVVVITAYARTDDAVKAMKLGAYDYIQKPFSMDEMLQTAKNAVEKCRLLRENISLRRAVKDRYKFSNIIGKSRAIRQVVEMCMKVKDIPSSVMITGESGTGKELVARVLHFNSLRASRPFVVVDCGAIPEQLIESELFGYVKGAFTGAASSYEGLIRAANGGTVFFDEVGEIPLPLQVKLLRVLQERVVKAIGDVEEHPVDIRVISATSRDIESEVRGGKFREDLYYRLNVMRINVPPLRERKEDIPLLVNHFIGGFSVRFGKYIRGLRPEAEEILIRYDFPGNVRELSNIIERAVALETTEEISAETINESFSMGKRFDYEFPGMEKMVAEVERYGLENFLGMMEEKILRKFVQLHGGDRKKVVKKLGITDRSFRYRLSKFGIKLN